VKVYNKRNKKIPWSAVYVGRPSKWGNPFVLESEDKRAECIKAYEDWLLKNPDLMDEMVVELRGKDLVCWCAPKACHADVIMRIANQPREKKADDN